MTALVLLATALVLGAHVIVPWRLAPRRTERPRNLWRLAALPSLASGVLLGLVWMADHPDHLLGVGWGEDPVTRTAVRFALITLVALAAVDGILLVAWRRLEPMAWRMVGALATLPLATVIFLQEVLRVGPGPRTTGAELAWATLIHALLALAAGHVADPEVGRRRPWVSLAAGCALPFYAFILPGWVTGKVLPYAFTLAAASLLLLAAPFVPPRLRRWAILAGIALSMVILAAVVEVAGTYPTRLEFLPAV